MVKKILADANMDAPKSFADGPFVLAYFVRRNPDSQVTEDTIGFSIDGAKCHLALADGMGGHPSGEEASRIAVSTTLDGLPGSPTNPLDIFDQANHKVMDLKCGAGTTLITAEIIEDQVRIYNVGDSLGLIVGGRGKTKLETLKHSSQGYGIEAGLLPDNQETSEKYGHEIENYIGSATMRVDATRSVPLGHTDFLILMTDGIYDHVDLEDISWRKDPQEICLQIAELAARSMDQKDAKKDDMSVVVLKRNAG